MAVVDGIINIGGHGEVSQTCCTSHINQRDSGRSTVSASQLIGQTCKKDQNAPVVDGIINTGGHGEVSQTCCTSHINQRDSGRSSSVGMAVLMSSVNGSANGRFKVR